MLVLLAILVPLSLLAAPASAAQDTDGDGVPDAVEDRDGDGLLEDNDSDGDGLPDYRDDDDDGDGVRTRDEDFDGDGDPTNDDLDEDGRPDYLDTTSPLDVDGDGYVSTEYGGDDCDDRRLAIHPGAFDPWYDGEDFDCLGNDDFDADGDGFASAFHGQGGEDCDDNDPEVHPGVEEDLTAVDRNCDGYSDPAGTLVPRGGCNCQTGGGPDGWLLALAACGLSFRPRRRE